MCGMADVDDALDALAVLADEERIRVVAALVLGRKTTDEVSEATGLAKRRALEALTKLEAAGLVTRVDARGRCEVGRLREIAKDARRREEPDDVGDVDRETASVL